jgi:hypothetical protein
LLPPISHHPEDHSLRLAPREVHPQIHEFTISVYTLPLTLDSDSAEFSAIRVEDYHDTYRLFAEYLARPYGKLD